jgi:hypothetical protein
MNTALESSITLVPPPQKKTSPPANRDWLRTAGWAKNDALYAEAVRLGQEYRRSMTVETEHADS